MKFSLIAIVFIFAVQLFAADRWGAFSDPFPIHDVAPYGDNGIMLATDGGLRFRTLEGDRVFLSQDGLETSAFYSVVSSTLGTFAVSEFGIVVAINGDGNTWRVLNRSYVKNNVRAVPRGAVLGKNILVIAFEDRLAFFDILKSTSLLTVDRIGNYSLQMNALKQLAVHGDTLYVKTERASYSRVMDWDNLASDIHLGDASSWNLLSAENTVSEFAPWDSTKVVAGDEILTESFLFDNNGCRVRWTLRSKDGYFLVGPYTILFLHDQGTPRIVELPYERYTLGEAYELQAMPMGGVLAASVDGKIGYAKPTGWREPEYAFNGLGNGFSAYSARMKVLSVLPDGYVFYHIWGFVYQIYSHWGTELEYSFNPTDGYCFDNYLDNFPISPFVVPAPDNSGFLTATASNSGYSIVYFNKNGDVRCAKNVGKQPVPGPMHVTVDDNGSWVIYVASKQGTALADIGGVDMHVFPAPRSNGGELSNGTSKTFTGISPAPLDMVYDSVKKRLWMVSMSNLAYLDSDRDTLIVPSSTNGIRGVEYTSIDADVHGNLWVGTTGHGVYRLTQKKSSPDTLSVINYNSRNGLLSDNVADVAIDAVDGVAWFAHERGITYYQRNDLKDASANLSDSARVLFRAYPVPFRPKEHAYFIIEGFTENAIVSIYNRGGALIRTFKGDDVLGGRLEWNGKDKSGKLVAPGVYYYVVNNGPKKKKGKFIIVH